MAANYPIFGSFNRGTSMSAGNENRFQLEANFARAKMPNGRDIAGPAVNPPMGPAALHRRVSVNAREVFSR